MGVIGLTYAYWMYKDTQNTFDVLGVKCFELTMTKETEGIHLYETSPTTEEEGKKQEGYQFTIKNTCNTSATYQVNLEEKNLGEIKRLNDQYIKVSLNDSKGKNLNTYEDTEATINEEDFTSDKSHKLTSGSLKPDEEETYTLKLWMDEETPPIEDVMNATFESKISIVATYIEDEKLKSDMKIAYEEQEDYSSESETITFTVESDNKDVYIIEYSLDGETYEPIELVEGKPSSKVNISLEFTEEKEYIIYFRDSLGNIKEQKFIPEKLDQTGPEIHVEETSDDKGAVLNIKFTDIKSGLKEYRIEDGISRIDLEEEWTSFTEEQEETIQYTSETNKEITIYGKDKFGNISKLEYIITKADITGPSLTIDNPKENEWTNTTLTITLNATDDISGVEKFYYSIDNDSWTEIENITEDGKKGSTTFEIINEYNGSYYFKAKDKLGNESEPQETTVKIDITEPTISSFTSQDTWGVSNTLTAYVEDTFSGIAGYYFSTSNTTPTSEWIPVENYPTDSQTYTGTANSNTTYYFYVKDQAGNVSSQPVTVNKVDDGTPSQSFAISPNTANGDNGWYKGTKPTITITATDSQSGVAKVETCTTTSDTCNNYTNLNLDGTNGDTSRKGTVTLLEGRNSKVCVKVTDGVGKTSEGCSPSYNVDITAPTITNVTGRVSGTSITFTANSPSDSLSGVSTAAGSYSWKLSNNATQTSAVNTATFTGLVGGQSYTVTVTLKDNAGNTRSVTSEQVIIPYPTVAETLGSVKTTTSGDGLYEVTPTLTGWTTKELRYAGANPDNYVTFNNEIAGWRIIGLVNVKIDKGNGQTAIEQRIKIIRKDSIGDFSWDHKPSGKGSSTDNYGSNDWTDSQLMEMLNDDYYQNSVEFASSETGNVKGLEESARKMIATDII